MVIMYTYQVNLFQIVPQYIGLDSLFINSILIEFSGMSSLIFIFIFNQFLSSTHLNLMHIYGTFFFCLIIIIFSVFFNQSDYHSKLIFSVLTGKSITSSNYQFLC